MRRLGDSATGTTSLYRYAADKDELLERITAPDGRGARSGRLSGGLREPTCGAVARRSA